MALLVEIAEIRRMVSKGDKTAADAARLFKITRPPNPPSRKTEYAKEC
jgi:hypothetical protein